jgi:hypothetical protein
MTKSRYVAMAFVAVLAILPNLSRAAEPKKVATVLGRRGTVVLDRIVGLSIMTPLGAPRLGAIGAYQAGFLTFSNGSSSFGGNESKGGAIGLTPSFDVFVGKNLTLGGEAQLTHQFSTQRSPGPYGTTESSWTSTGFAAMPRVGLYLPVSDAFALWGRLGLGAGYTYTNESQGQLAWSRKGLTLAVALDVAMVIPLTRALSLQVGPKLTASTTTELDPGLTKEEGSGVALGVAGSLSYAF